MIEREKTYLANYLPEGLEECKNKEIIDIYYPKEAYHPILRLRKNGEKMELTKKYPVDNGDKSELVEETIVLSKGEYAVLEKLEGKKVAKIRYYYPYKGRVAEFDVFLGALAGLVVVDVEFDSSEEKGVFDMPDFCMADITQEEFVAGGFICGKTYEEVKPTLDKYGYEKIIVVKQ